MEWSKIKNIIILILLMVNSFLLVSLLGRRQAADSYARSAVTRAVQVLEQNGIAVSEDALTDTSSLSALTVSRDLQAERAVAQALLGEDAVRTDQSGGLYAYESERGTALFRPNGDFSVDLAQCPLDGRTPTEHALALLSEMGLEGELVSGPEPGKNSNVTLMQVVNGAPIYSCRLVFQYDGSRLLGVRGALLAGTALTAADETEYLDLSNTLIRFLDGVLERSDVCSAITGLRPGYRFTQSFGTDARLAPTWLVTTNVSSYFMDCATGALEPADS